MTNVMRAKSHWDCSGEMRNINILVAYATPARKCLLTISPSVLKKKQDLASLQRN